MQTVRRNIFSAMGILSVAAGTIGGIAYIRASGFEGDYVKLRSQGLLRGRTVADGINIAYLRTRGREDLLVSKLESEQHACVAAFKADSVVWSEQYGIPKVCECFAMDKETLIGSKLKTSSNGDRTSSKQLNDQPQTPGDNFERGRTVEQWLQQRGLRGYDQHNFEKLSSYVEDITQTLADPNLSADSVDTLKSVSAYISEVADLYQFRSVVLSEKSSSAVDTSATNTPITAITSPSFVMPTVKMTTVNDAQDELAIEPNGLLTIMKQNDCDIYWYFKTKYGLGSDC